MNSNAFQGVRSAADRVRVQGASGRLIEKQPHSLLFFSAGYTVLKHQPPEMIRSR